MEGRRENRLSPFSVVLIMVALSLVGIASLPRLNVQYTPTKEGQSIYVSFGYSNASAEVVEAEVTSKLEGVLVGVGGVSGSSSSSYKGGGSVTVNFRKGTDMDASRFEVASAVRNIYPSLPKGVSYPYISLSGGGDGSNISYIVKGSIPSREISKYLKEHVLSQISAIKGVEKVDIGGGVPFRRVITFDAAKASSSRINASDIASAFDSYYGSSVIGISEEEGGLLTVRLKEASGDDFGNIPVKNINGRVVYLREIADWRDEESLPDSYYRVNGLNSITMNVGIASSSNLLNTASAIKTRMSELQKSFPTEITASVAYDSSDYVRDELGKIYKRTALCILILLIFVFIISRSWRYLFVVIFTLVVNVLTALAIYAFSGLPLHIYTLAGITVSLGIIIDTSIVMIDHFSHYADRKVFPAILAAVATTIGALMMVLLLPESEKANLIDFICVIVINLSISLLVSYFFIPSLMEYIPVRGTLSTRSIRRVRKTVRRNDRYRKYIQWGVRHRWVYVVAFILAFGIPLCLLPEPASKRESKEPEGFAKFVNKIVSWKPYSNNRSKVDKYLGSTFAMFQQSLGRSNFYRQPQKKQLYIRAGMLEGCTVNQLNEVVKSMENYLAKFHEIEVFTTNISSYDNATIVVEFKPEFEHSSFPSILKSEVTRMAINFGGANWQVYGIDDNSFNNNIVSTYKSNRISLSGYNYEQLYSYAETLVKYISDNKRVKGPEIWTGNWRAAPKMEFVMDYDFGKMTAAGINPYAYFGTLSSLLFENNIGTSKYNGEIVDVVLRSSDIDNYDLWHVLNSPIDIGESKMTLSSVGSIEKKRTGLVISKENQSFKLDVCYDFIGSYELSSRLSKKAVDYMNSQVLPIGFKASVPEWGWFDGDKKQYIWLILLIVAVIYVMLAMTFESFIYPLPVIFMIPISFIGLFLVFGLTDFSFDQGGFAAFVMLCGIVVNAGIYLVTTYQSLMKDKRPDLSRRSGLYVKAYSRKITPIFLTVVSTILGLLPFLSEGPEEVFWFDFAIGTIAGMFLSIIAIRFVLPVFVVEERLDKRI